MSAIEPVYLGYLLYTQQTASFILGLYNRPDFNVSFNADIHAACPFPRGFLQWASRPGAEVEPDYRRGENGAPDVLTDLWSHPEAPTRSNLMVAIYSDVTTSGEDSLVKPTVLAAGPNAQGVLFFRMSCCEPDDVSALFLLPDGKDGYVYKIRHKNPGAIPAEFRDMFTGVDSVKVVGAGVLEHLYAHMAGVGHDCGTKSGFFKSEVTGTRSGFTCDPV